MCALTLKQNTHAAIIYPDHKTNILFDSKNPVIGFFKNPTLQIKWHGQVESCYYWTKLNGQNSRRETNRNREAEAEANTVPGPQSLNYLNKNHCYHKSGIKKSYTFYIQIMVY